MGFQPGTPKPLNSGRKKGQVNQSTAVKDRLAALGVDPFEIQALIASGRVDCGVCHGEGKTTYQPARGRPGKRTCESCYGSGKERISPGERSRACDSLMKYCEPQLKQIEVQGAGGGPILTEVRLHFIEAHDGKPVSGQ